VHDFLVACIHLAEVSGNIIRDLHLAQKGNVEYKNKGG
jgi:3'-phosphoadenosine 5'-phosphosulfate (PAPS) 3'-phosphatase